MSTMSSPSPSAAAGYDAILVVGFGGPEKRDDVMPFLENVLRGRNIPRERMLEVAEHYYHFGGVSPINAQVRALIGALRPELDRHGIGLPIYWGNRNWHPILADTLAYDGRRRGPAGRWRSSWPPTAPTRAAASIARTSSAPRTWSAPGAPAVEKIRVFYNHPDFIAANADRVARGPGVDTRRATRPGAAGLHGAQHPELHGRPTADYERQLQETCRLVAEAVDVGARPLAARLPEPERPADRPLARAGYRRPPGGSPRRAAC